MVLSFFLGSEFISFLSGILESGVSIWRNDGMHGFLDYKGGDTLTKVIGQTKRIRRSAT